MSIYAVFDYQKAKVLSILKNIWQIDLTSHQVVATSLGGISLGGALFHTMPAALLTGLFGFALVQNLHFKNLCARQAQRELAETVDKGQDTPKTP
jgi:hypothetical protein